MTKKKKSAAKRRKKTLKGSESARNQDRRQEQRRDFAEGAHRQLTEIEQRLTKTASEIHAASMYFLHTEAATGLTLARIAMDSHDGEKRARNRRNAREAYDTVLANRASAAPTSEEWEPIQQKLVKLREMLESLGERF